MKEGEDMRLCENRHSACYKALKDADRHNRPPNKLHMELLSVCRQAYIEANPILWSTTTWSPWGIGNWRTWCDLRTPLQRQLIKKVHLDTDVVRDYVHKTSITPFANWKELYVSVTVTKSAYTNIKQYFSADEIFVICSGTEIYPLGHAPELHSDNGGTTWEERAALAEAFQSHLAVMGQEARDRKEKSEAKANARKYKKNALTNAEVSSDS